MKTAVYLAITKSGRVRISKKKPALASNEVAVLTVISIPDVFFPFVPIRHDITISDKVKLEPIESSDKIEVLNVPAGDSGINV